MGQTILTGIEGVELGSEDGAFLAEEEIGGVILFAHNYQDPLQLASLIQSIQSLKGELPRYIGVDNEGGRVFRFKGDGSFTHPPSAYQLAKEKTPEEVCQIAMVQAKELFTCGVNLNFAPVCDIWSNEKNKVIGDRAFGKTGASVIPYIGEVIRGLQDGGVSACAKHFPGHGHSEEDSHYQLPQVNRELEQLRREEFLPFAEAIKASVEFIMMAHLIIPQIDPTLPTSLSPKAHALLREELAFNNLIITDDLDMNAITDHYSIEQGAMEAIKAGSDMVICRQRKSAEQALVGLKKLSPDILQVPLQRIYRAKNRRLKSYHPPHLAEVEQFFS